MYRFNPELGTVERATQSFGPFFVERALTAGRGQASFGPHAAAAAFHVARRPQPRDGSLVTTANQFTDEAAPFDVDHLTLNIDADIATLYGTVGVTDSLDVGIAAPLVSLTMDGSRINTYRGQVFTQATASGRAIGLADLVVRARVHVLQRGRLALAAAVDVRLPTGRQEDLLGAGTTSYKFRRSDRSTGGARRRTRTWR